LYEIQEIIKPTLYKIQEIIKPTLYKIQEIIRNIKRKKTPGNDNINAELLQVACPQMTQRIQEIILNIWRNERMPNECNKSIICQIYKKGKNPNVPFVEESHSLILHIRS